MAMKTSRKGKHHTCRCEALVLRAYPDGDHCSVGLGQNDPTLKVGDRITLKRAFELFNAKIAENDAVLNKLLRKNTTLSQHQYDALSDLYYNQANRTTPALVHLCNYGQFETVAEIFPFFNRDSKGRKLAGLTDRRLSNQRQFRDADYGELGPIKFWPDGVRDASGKPIPVQWYHIQPGDLE